MNACSANTDDPPPYFLINELHQLTFKLHEENQEEWHADDTSLAGLLAWSHFVDQNAVIKSKVNWSNLEERAYFLNKLYAFCLTNHLTFPLTIDTELSIRIVGKI